MIITIDGPAGSGKSTAARKLAARLEIAYLDTGAMYRAIAQAGLERGLNFNDSSALIALANSIRLEMDCGPTHTRVRVDGHDVSESIRSMAVSGVTGKVAGEPAIRKLLVEKQRTIGLQLGSFVSEGRDQGAVVFPQADAKFVLQAGPAKRAERRFQEMIADGESVTIKEIEENIASRDQADIKQWEPLLQGGKAMIIDTTHLTIQGVVERMIEALPGNLKSRVSRS